MANASLTARSQRDPQLQCLMICCPDTALQCACNRRRFGLKGTDVFFGPRLTLCSFPRHSQLRIANAQVNKITSLLDNSRPEYIDQQFSFWRFCSQEPNGGPPNPETCGSSIRFEAHGPHFNTGNAQRKYDQHAPPIHCGSK